MGDRYCEIRFEDLILDTERSAAKLVRFVNGTEAEGVRKLVDRIDRTKKPDRAHAWRREMDERERFVCEAAAGDVLRACGYETEFDGKAKLSAFRTRLHQSTDLVYRAVNRAVRPVRRWNLRRSRRRQR